MAIHPTAVIDSTAQLADDIEVGPGAVIGAHVEIGSECVIMAGAVVCARTVMGKHNRVHFHAVIGHEPQFVGFNAAVNSRVRIGDNNNFREFSTVHRPIHEGAETIIGNDNYLMASAHVAHDCVLGNNITMVNCAGLAGHCVVEDRAFISGLVGVHQFCRIGRLAMVGGLGGVSKDVPPFMTVKGSLGFIAGVNTVGMRRAGIDGPTRMAIKNAFRELFRSGRSLPNALAAIRGEWKDKGPLPPELEHLLGFCETKSRRGIMAGRSVEHSPENLDGSSRDD